MKVYLVHWSEGEPVAVVAKSYGDAVKLFLAWVSHDNTDHDDEAIESQINSVALIAEEVVKPEQFPDALEKITCDYCGSPAIGNHFGTRYCAEHNRNQKES